MICDQFSHTFLDPAERLSIIRDIINNGIKSAHVLNRLGGLNPAGGDS